MGSFVRGAVLLLLVLLAGCHSRGGQPQMPPPDVTVYVMKEQTIPVVFDFIGFAESSHPVEIRARVEGYLDKIAYQDGQLVQQGDLLFQLDPKQYEAKVAEAKGEVARQKAINANAVLTVNRLKPLYEQKAASKKDLDNAIASQLASEAAVLSAEAQLMYNEINLGYTTITSPITGYADKAKLREGALINPASNSLLTTVSVLDPIWVYFTVSDNDFLRVEKQQIKPGKGDMGGVTISSGIVLPKEDQYVVEVLMSDGTKFPHKGTVDFSSPTYNRSTGTILVRGVFPNPQAALRPGQFVRVKVYGAERPNALIVPQRAVMQKKGGLYVWLIDKDGKVAAQDISVGDWYGDYQVVTNGLKPGDRIVVDGINKVMEGMEVHVTGPWNPSGKPALEGSPMAPPAPAGPTGPTGAKG